jgi:NDP-sugar pyrophosphorylase family protein
MVEVGGKPQIVRQIETLAMLGCSGITCMVRDDYPEAQDAVLDRSWKVPVDVCMCHTPSSLHTLAEGLGQTGEGAVFATMVDTVMRADDWRTAYAGSASALEKGADLALVVTPFVDDEAALWVRRDQAGRVTSLGKEPVDPPCVTGGVYALRPGIGPLASAAVKSGMHRMRAFLSDLVEKGLVVQSVEVPRVIDLDRPEDLAAANAWLAVGQA